MDRAVENAKEHNCNKHSQSACGICFKQLPIDPRISMKTKTKPVVILRIHTFVVVLLFYVYGKHPRSCRDRQLT